MAKVRDRNRIPNVLREIARINLREARVGVFEDKSRSLALIAKMHEFGVDQVLTDDLYKRLRALARTYNAPTESLPKLGERFRVPERSFLRGTADQSHERLRRAAAEAIPKMMRGELDAYETLFETGKALREAITDRIRSGTEFEPLHPFTIALTGETKPLVGREGVFESGQGIFLRVVRKS